MADSFASPPPALAIEALRFRYRGAAGEEFELALPTFDLAAGEECLLSGASGSGKSTLLGVLAGLVRPTSGSVQRRAGATTAFVAQHQEQHRWMPLSVAEVVRMGRYGERGLLGRLRSDDRRAVADGIDKMAVGDLVRKPFGDLSGGQRQRVLVAQALASQPDLLLLDEPITGLDLTSQQLILEVVAAERDRGTTVVLSTHHLGEARQTDRVVLLAGCVMADGRPADVLRPELLAEAFGNRMVSTDGGAVVIDDHGHGHDDRAGIDARDLLPQHRHDHAHHSHDHAPDHVAER